MFRRARKIAKATLCLPMYLHGTLRLPLDGLPLKLKFGNFSKTH